MGKMSASLNRILNAVVGIPTKPTNVVLENTQKPSGIVTALDDSDGVAPGVEQHLISQFCIVRFSGVFYGKPEAGHVTFDRPVIIVAAFPELYVLQDLETKNMYYIDRARKLSLGCRMRADVIMEDPISKGMVGAHMIMGTPAPAPSPCNSVTLYT